MPLDTPPQEDHANAAQENAPIVLIVDDDAMILLALRRILKDVAQVIEGKNTDDARRLMIEKNRLSSFWMMLCPVRLQA